jgi:hypothetical protein
MAQPARVRKGALALPEAEEGSLAGTIAWSVCRKTFASLSPDGVRVQFHLPEDQVAAIVAEHPGATRVALPDTAVDVGLPLAGLDVRVLDRLLRLAWEAQAPEHLVAVHGDGAAGPRAGDLPRIGRPATDALALAGVTTLDQVAEHTEQELLDLHGVGPEAVRILGEVLAAGGRSFRAGRSPAR